MPRAQALLDQLGPDADPRLLQAVAGVYMHQCQWQQAAAIMGRIPQPDLNVQCQRQLAINLSDLQPHRPALYNLLFQAQPQTQCRISRLSSDQLTVVQTLPDATPVSLSPGLDPKQEAQKLLASLAKVVSNREALLLSGVGDGYVLNRIAQEVDEDVTGLYPTVYVVEPDPEVLLHSMMIHDFTGPDGPIQREHYRWFVGPQWETQLHEALLTDQYLPTPSEVVTQSLRGDQIKQHLTQITRTRQATHSQARQQVMAYYQSVTPQQLVSLLGPDPPRPPRVLVLTSRFTTVLQHASRDAMDAFKQMGWETKLVIEPTAYHRVTYIALQHEVLTFEPDLVFVIDHLRHEQQGVFPPQLPFVCWIQDHLPALTAQSAGRRITPRDFVLTAVAGFYHQRYGYPLRQCIDVPRLTRIAIKPTRWVSDGDDLVYVSNASRQPSQIADELVSGCQASPELHRLIRACCDRLMSIYDGGRWVATPRELFALVKEAEADQQVPLEREGARRQLVLKLFHPLNDALYRQQALQWAAQIASELGLSLALYGQGWDDHPLFSAHARGRVAYGLRLEQLTRSVKINLQLEPYLCVSHQRLLDGLTAGGFYLVRDHPMNRFPAQLARFLQANLDEPVSDLATAMQRIDPEKQDAFGALQRDCACLDLIEDDVIQVIHSWQRLRWISDQGEVLPRYDAVAFTDRDSLKQKIQMYLRAPDQREQIANAQRRSIEQRFSYQAGLTHAINQIRQLIGEEINDQPSVEVGIAPEAQV